MRIKKANLQYWVFDFNYNTKQVERFNILEDMAEDIAKKINSNEIKDKATLRTYLEREFMYHYWSKAEYEYCVADLFDTKFENGQKLDVWFQIEPNIELIVNHVIKEMEIKF